MPVLPGVKAKVLTITSKSLPDLTLLGLQAHLTLLSPLFLLLSLLQPKLLKGSLNKSGQLVPASGPLCLLLLLLRMLFPKCLHGWLPLFLQMFTQYHLSEAFQDLDV